MAKCPIERLKGLLLTQKIESKMLDEILQTAQKEIEDAVRFAQNSPVPPVTAARSNMCTPEDRRR